MTSRSSRCFSVYGVVAMLLTVLCWMSVAEAQSKDKVAAYKKALNSAYAKFQDSNYSGARADFEEAYRIKKAPLILFNIAATFRRQELPEDALEYYQKFIEECSSAACKRENSAQIEQAIGTIETLEKQLEPVEEDPVDTTDDSEDTVDDDASESDGVLTDDGDDTTSDETPTANAGRGLRWAGIGVAVVGLAGLGFGGVEAFGALSLKSEIEDELAAMGANPMWSQDLLDKDQRRSDKVTLFYISSAVGGVALIGGTALYLIGRKKGAASKKESVAVVPTAGNGRAGLAVLGRF